MVRVTSAFSIEKARRTQSRLAKQIVCEDELPKKPRLVAGVDVAYAHETSIGAAAVLDYGSLELVETRTATCKTRFPYVPTLLSFREVPPAVLSIRKLKVPPDVFLADGHGLAHPYRCGFACHLGLVLNKPTIGVAKSRLFGEVEMTKTSKNVALLKHEDEVIGAEIVTEFSGKPIYVSVGHMVSLKTAVKIVKHCTRNSRIPEPILEAHKLATAAKRKINIE